MKNNNSVKVSISLFTVVYEKEKHCLYTARERIFGILNTLSQKNEHLEDGKQAMKRFYDYLLDIMLPERAEVMIRESIDLYLKERKRVWGMSQYDTDFYLEHIYTGNE